MPGLPDATKYIAPRTGHGPYALNEAARRPHIFLITVDMIPPEAYRKEGYRQVMQLPNLDRLESKSVTFANAFCPSPLCGPSRAAFLTGRYPYLTVNEERAHDGHTYVLRQDDIIFPEYLRASGYVTRHVGKCHVGAAKFLDAFGENDHPWDRWAPPIHDDDEYHQYLESLGVKDRRAKKEIRGLRSDRTSLGNLYGCWLEQEDGRPFPLEATYPYYLATRAARTLRTVRRRTGRGKPIYLQLDFFAPHQPFMIPSGLEDRERELRKAVKLPESFYALQRNNFKPPVGEPKVYQTYRTAHGLYAEETARDYIVANLLQVEVVDRAMGVFLSALQEEGLYEDSVIIFMGDHGEMNGELALVDKGVYGHPKVVRVPLVVHMGDAAQTGRNIETPVTLLDVAPTILSQAGIAPYHRLDGSDLGQMIQGEAIERSQDFLFEAGWHLAPNPAVSIQHRYEDSGHFLYTYNLADRYDELYDLCDSSYRNLAADPDYQSIRDDMIRRLGGVLRSDPRWRCYWHALRVEHADRVRVEEGDQQMFIPE